MFYFQCLRQKVGGRGGIRTHGTLAGTPVFKTGALNRSATLPSQRRQSLGAIKIKNAWQRDPIWSKAPSCPTKPRYRRPDHRRDSIVRGILRLRSWMLISPPAVADFHSVA